MGALHSSLSSGRWSHDCRSRDLAATTSHMSHTGISAALSSHNLISIIRIRSRCRHELAIATMWKMRQTINASWLPYSKRSYLVILTPTYTSYSSSHHLPPAPSLGLLSLGIVLSNTEMHLINQETHCTYGRLQDLVIWISVFHKRWRSSNCNHGSISRRLVFMNGRGVRIAGYVSTSSEPPWRIDIRRWNKGRHHKGFCATIGSGYMCMISMSYTGNYWKSGRNHSTFSFCKTPEG